MYSLYAYLFEATYAFENKLKKSPSLIIKSLYNAKGFFGIYLPLTVLSKTLRLPDHLFTKVLLIVATHLLSLFCNDYDLFNSEVFGSVFPRILL